MDQNQKLLLVDDIPENIFALESMLEEEGREFVKAGSGEEALKKLLKEDIDLILLDVQMPGMDGFETAQLIRGTQRTKHIPIIFVTAISKEQKHIFKGYEAGAVDYMFKPLEPEIVQSKVKIFLELAQHRRKLQIQNQELATAKRNSDNIFANVDQGIFLINNEFRIKPQYSISLEEMLDENNLSNKDLTKILKSGLDKDLYETCLEYLHLMFKVSINEENLSPLNPLQQVKFKKNDEGGEKYLTFKFKRVIINDQLEELIATVSDKTAQVLLKTQLEKAEEQSMRNLEMIKILEIEPSLVKEFMQQADSELKQAYDWVKNNQCDEDSIEAIYRIMHSIKGNASLLGLNFISEKSHQIEEIVLIMNDDKALCEKHNQEVLKIMKDLFKILNEIHILIAKMRYFNKHYDDKSGYEGQILLKALENLLERLEEEYQRKFHLDFMEFNVGLIPDGELLMVKDILIQLFRNAVIHSYQSQEERVKLGKKPEVTLSLSSHKIDDQLIIIFEDDGKGLQYDKLKQKAVDLKKAKASKLDKMSHKELTEIIFESGVSTAEETDLVAGRGFGMSVIKSKLENIDGKIEVESEENEYCRFKIYLPLSVERKSEQDLK